MTSLYLYPDKEKFSTDQKRGPENTGCKDSGHPQQAEKL